MMNSMRLLQALVLSLGVMMMPLAQANNQDMTERQAQFMAVYLLHFANFIEWPNAEQSDDTQFNLCFYADKRLSDYISELDGESTDSGTINTINTPEIDQISQCKIVFIESTQIDRFAQIKTQPSAILFVSDSTGFIEQGGTMEYFIANNKLRFAVNMKAAKEKGLILSSKLLRIAKIVE